MFQTKKIPRKFSVTKFWVKNVKNLLNHKKKIVYTNQKKNV